MNHKVNNVQQLYYSASDLYTNIVVGGDASADTIIHNLVDAIENLKLNWKGIDAGLKIQELIKVHNEMVTVRNALAQLACDSSTVAANYREIQNTNGAMLEPLSPLNIDTKSVIGDYSDTADTIDINPSAEEGRTHVDAANADIDTFINNTSSKYQEIMDNWTAGTGRESAQGAFDTFVSNAKKYKETLADVSENVAKALQNYSF